MEAPLPDTRRGTATASTWRFRPLHTEPDPNQSGGAPDGPGRAAASRTSTGAGPGDRGHKSEDVRIGGAEMRKCGHAPLSVSRMVRIATALKRDAPAAICSPGLRPRKPAAHPHRFPDDQRHDTAGNAADRASSPGRGRIGAAAFSLGEQAEHAGIVLGDHVDSAGVGSAAVPPKGGTAIAARNVDGVGVVDRREQSFVVGYENSLFEPLVIRGLEIGIDVVDTPTIASRRAAGWSDTAVSARSVRPACRSAEPAVLQSAISARLSRDRRRRASRSCRPRRRHRDRARCAGSS